VNEPQDQNGFQKAATTLNGIGSMLLWLALALVMGGLTLAMLHH
jgi:hypothetical protein